MVQLGKINEVIEKTVENLKKTTEDATGTIETTNTAPNGETHTVKITKDANVLVGEITYVNLLEIWQGTDKSTGKVLEFFFNDLTSRETAAVSPGVLLRFKPGLMMSQGGRMDASATVQVSMVADGTTVVETINMSGFSTPKETDPTKRFNGTIKVVDEGSFIMISSLFYMNLSVGPCGANTPFYNTMVIVSTDAEASEETTTSYSNAMVGHSTTGISNVGCGGTALEQNNGYFNSADNGTFVQDGVTSDLDSNYPTIEQVDTIYTSMTSDTVFNASDIAAMNIQFLAPAGSNSAE